MAKGGMTHEQWARLKGKGPRFRWATDANGKPLDTGRSNRASARPGRGRGKHTRQGPQRASAAPIDMHGIPSWTQARVPSEDLALWQTTKPRPWTKRQVNRAKNRLARAARRASRAS